MIDPLGLHSLIGVRDTGSVTAAAALLGYTPSAVSQQLARLERDSGAAVIERVGRGVVLSPHGRLLAARAEALLADLEALERVSAQDRQPEGPFAVTSFSTAIRALLVPAIVRLRSTAPALRLTVDEQDPAEALLRLERGAVDLAVVHDWERLALPVPDSLTLEPLLRDVADVLLPADHPMAAHRSVTPADLLDETWVSSPVGTFCREWLVRMFLDTGTHPRIAYDDRDFSSHIAFVAERLAIALVPRLGREVLPDSVVAVPAAPRSSRQVSAAWRRATGPSTARDAVIAALRAAASP
jgi:DNA-binding transcriptional LysR family regulator